MLCKTLKAVIIEGDFHPKGVEVNIDSATFERLNGFVKTISEKSDEDTQQKPPEKPIDKMSLDELKAKAKELGLPTKGTKADLIEKITLSTK